MLPDRIWITARDGIRLAADLYMPDDDGPWPTLLEALPYRKDDLTSQSHTEDYERLCCDGRYVVCRLDVRGTGTSAGRASDEYPDSELDDLNDVISWLATQPWSTGKVGMFGYSYSGFNSLQVACTRPPALAAICAVYATDDRYTDDVHYMGGALRAIDQIDYCHYMTACNALPPVPALFGDGWKDEWRGRLDDHEPWIINWLTEQHDGPYWRRGSLRPGYDRIDCATMLVGGWADGYRNNSLRTFASLTCDKSLLMGPWSHSAPARSRPGPHIEVVPEMIRWFDHYTRGIDNGVDQQPPIRVFMRGSTAPQPDLAMYSGCWRGESTWPSPSSRIVHKRLDDLSVATDVLAVRSDVGTAAWNSCAGGLPWGQPTDQREDDAWSLRYEWPVDDAMALLGHPVLRVRVAADQPVASLSAKLCDVFPDGTSALITRGFLNLTHRVSSTDPTPLTPGVFEAIQLELEATSWLFTPGHHVRLSINGVDWPNTWVAPQPFSLSVDRGSLHLQLPVVDGDGEPLPPFTLPPEPAPQAELAMVSIEPDPVPTEWRIERDVLGRTTTARTQYGGPSEGRDHCAQNEIYRGEVGVSSTVPGTSWANATTRYELSWPEGDCLIEARMRLHSDPTTLHLDIELDADLDGQQFSRRRWSRSIPRRLM